MSTNHDDLIERSAHIHWPDGLHPDTADLFAHNAIVIDAAAESILATRTLDRRSSRSASYSNPEITGSDQLRVSTRSQPASLRAAMSLNPQIASVRSNSARKDFR